MEDKHIVYVLAQLNHAQSTSALCIFYKMLDAVFLVSTFLCGHF